MARLASLTCIFSNKNAPGFAPRALMCAAAGFIAGAAGTDGFSPLALPLTSALWLVSNGGCFALAGTLMGTLAAGSWASFCVCALYGGAELILSLRKSAPRGNAALIQAFIIMTLTQGALLPFIYPLWGNEFFLALACLAVCPALTVAAARGAKALSGYMRGTRMAVSDAVALAISAALILAALITADGGAGAAGVTALLISAFAVCRSRAGAADELERTRKGLLCAADVARGMAEFIGMSGGDALAASQTEGMGGAMEKLARGNERILKPRIALKTGMAFEAMPGSACSGDTAAIRRADDRMILILSDGMGSGPAAHRESSTAAALFGDMLALDYEPSSAQRSVNGLLMLSGEETYATLDAAVIDLVTGEVRLTKFGAPASYILRDGRVKTVESSAPPAGIIDRAEAGVSSAVLRRGDAFIMMTDGLADALGTELIASIVDRAGAANTATDAAKALIDYAVQRGHNDDMSVIVARVTGA